MRAIAVRQDCDYILFVSADLPNVVAVVPLPYASRPESDPRWPETTFFDSMEDWLERGMKQDHDDITTWLRDDAEPNVEPNGPRPAG